MAILSVVSMEQVCRLLAVVFSASQMCDNFVDILMNAIAQTDTSKIWSDTDGMSTVYRGRDIHVVDAVRAFFTGAEQPNVHMTMEATFSKGWVA